MCEIRNPYEPLIQILREIAAAQDANATVAALAMIFIGIDTMALLGCPIGQVEQTRDDFITWVDRYLTADINSEYQYDGRDIYAARCALLHGYGVTARLHSSTTPPRKFGYRDNGTHRLDEAERFALISIAVLVHDFSAAVEKFLHAIISEPELKDRTDSRINTLLVTSILK